MAKLSMCLSFLLAFGISHHFSLARGAQCVDKERKDCSAWKQRNYCLQFSQWYGYMKENCKKTCGFCTSTKEMEDCRDKNQECSRWALRNECKINPAYMNKNCRLSCGLCKATNSECKDNNRECSDWAGKGECNKNPGYMNKNCRLSCGLCKELSTTATKDGCKDKNKDCSDWAGKGECNKNPGYMNKNCRLSCGLCEVLSSLGNCKDSYDTNKCQRWASEGECNKNPGWMSMNCQNSCKKCAVSVATTVSSIVQTDKKHADINSVYCGLRLKGFIVGGKEAAVGDWPWQVGIASKSRPYSPFCGGSLINKQWVVTASHCFGSRYSTNYKPSNIVVLIAEHDLRKVEGKEIISNVSMIVRHKQYLGYGAYDNDITLIKLEKPINYNYLIKPICLPAPNKEEKAGKMCYITGWGSLGTHKKVAKVLQEAKVPIVDRKRCNETLSVFAEFTDRMICAGYTKGGIDACQGDSGGPLVCNNGGRYELEGIVSWGRGCGDANSYGAYTKVSKYIDWIKTNIKN